MKQKWYKTNLAKAALIIAAHAAAVVMTASLLWIVSYPAIQEELLEGDPAEEYKDTANFADQMLNYSMQAVNGINEKKWLETDGEYDPDKLVDIEEFSNTGKITGESESGLAYRLGDLVEWYQSGNYEMLYNGEVYIDSGEAYSGTDESKIIVCEKTDGTYYYYTFNEFSALIKNGGLHFIDENEEAGASTDEILSDVRKGYGFPQSMFLGIENSEGIRIYSDCWVYDGVLIKEECKPEGTAGIMELANENSDWNGRLDEAYQMVYSAIETVGHSYDTYTDINAGIEEGDTNFSYMYVDMRGKHVYTNKTEYEAYEHVESNIEKMKDSGRYIIVAPKLVDIETNMDKADIALWRDQIKYSSVDEEEFLFVAAVDTSYPIHDVFYSENELYDKYGNSARRQAVLGAAAGILFIISILWLTVIAGRSAKDEELHLNGFDRWKTELAAAVIIFAWSIPFIFWLRCGITDSYIVTRGMRKFALQEVYINDIFPYIIVSCIFVCFTCSMFLLGFLSLVRRIKAETVWKNSLLRSMGVFFKCVLQNMSSIWRSILLYGIFIILHWLCVLSIGHVGEGRALLMLLVEGAAFVYLVYRAIGTTRIEKGIMKISGGEVNYKVSTAGLLPEHQRIAENINSIGEGLDAALEESIKSERLKTDLITNVSHDIKTPLTSIINYVELLKQENFDNPKIQWYLEVLEAKSQRLKTLTEDVVEASKISSGNISLEFMNINLVEMIQQTSGEFEEKFKERSLTEVLNLPEETVVISADGRRTWRILENIYNNAAKYAMEGTRIYADLAVKNEKASFSLKNVSEQPLNISADELTERFIRGDISRSTEGSGLGLSIAKTLTQMQGGEFQLYLDGDLFKVTIEFSVVN